MITSNVFDTFRIVFDDGRELCLIARNMVHAHWSARDLEPQKEIVNVQKLGMWEDNG